LYGAPFRFESKVDIREVVVHGDWALTRVELDVEIVPTKGASPVKLSGPTVSVWRKTPQGRWTIWRDANMVAPVS
jgi:ketosteroid isomerase-like protein